jgi:hypothetical protein
MDARRSTDIIQNTHNNSSINNNSNAVNSNIPNKLILEEISEENLADGRIQLEHILEQRMRLLGAHHIATGEVQYTIGLFEYFLFGNVNNAEKFISTAHSVYIQQLDEKHPSRVHVATVLELVRQQMEG